MDKNKEKWSFEREDKRKTRKKNRIGRKKDFKDRPFADTKKKKYSKKHMNEEPVQETAMESTSESPVEVKAPVEKKKRAPNPALIAFGKLSKHVSEKLGISNGPKAKKVAGAANREIKEKHPELSAVEIAEKAQAHFDANMERFRKIIEE